MRVLIASDHGGFSLKQNIIDFFKKENIEYIDIGPDQLDPFDDYTYYAEILCKKLQENHGDFGILICKSGIGMSIVANKFKNIYAALCFSKLHAKKSREHNNANVLALDSQYEGDDPIEIVKFFLNSTFNESSSRHTRRLKEIKRIEEENFSN